MLYATPKLDAEDRRVLDEVDGFYAAFRRATDGSQPREWIGGVRNRLIAGAIQGSNTIEGFTVDRSTASAVVTGSPVSANVPEESKQAVLGYRNVLTWVMRSSEMEFFEYSETLLSVLPFIMTRTEKKSPGLYRRSGIMVTGEDPLVPVYVGPDADRVPGLMRELVDWLNHGDLDAPLLVRAAMAHLNLVSIHPWRDGNGRMSRCVQTLVIARGGRLAPEFCSIEEWLGGHEINTFGYYQALGETQQGTFQSDRSAHGWVRFCLRAHHIQAQVVGRRLEYGHQVWLAMAETVQRRGFKERIVSALYAAAYDQLRREVLQQEEGLSRDQAVRDIRMLEHAGLIKAVGYGPTLYYVAAGEAKDAAAAIADSLTAPAREPYDRR